MRYFTRDRLLQSQDDVGIVESDESRERRLSIAHVHWETANDEYNKYLVQVLTSLPPALQYLAKSCLHDATVESVERLDGVVNVSLGLGKAFWFPPRVSKLTLRFQGVIAENGFAGIVGQSLLYDEIFVDSDCYEFRGLLEKGEVAIHFREFAISIESQAAERQPPLWVE